LQDHSLSFMPWGYHQVAAAPGYTLYYSFFLAGKGKSLTGYTDPDHSWITDSK
jgi:5-deoxy-glucuronate isomerase